MPEESSEPFFQRSRRSIVYESGHKARPPINKRVILIAAGILVLILLVIFAVFASDNGEENLEEAESPVPTQEAFPTDEPTPTVEITPTEEVTPTPLASNNKDSDTSLDRSSLTIEIQNGSGVAGAATKARNILEDLGYEVLSAGNADNFDYETTVIKVKSTKKNFLELLEGDLEDDYTIEETSTSLTGTVADAVVIIGAE